MPDQIKASSDHRKLNSIFIPLTHIEGVFIWLCKDIQVIAEANSGILSGL